MSNTKELFAPLDAKEKQQKLIKPVSNENDGWNVLTPVPEHALEADPQHNGKRPDNLYAYNDENGSLIYYVCRYNQGKGKKFFRSFSYCRNRNGQEQWYSIAPKAPRPLYGLEFLKQKPSAKIVITEGEKACEAARKLLPDYIVMTSPNGASGVQKTDWTPLKD